MNAFSKPNTMPQSTPSWCWNVTLSCYRRSKKSSVLSTGHSNYLVFAWICPSVIFWTLLSGCGWSENAAGFCGLVEESYHLDMDESLSGVAFESDLVAGFDSETAACTGAVTNLFSGIGFEGG